LTGSHRPEAIFIAYGKGIKKNSTKEKFHVTGAHTYDNISDVYFLQNLPIPSDMDGKVVIDITTEERIQQDPSGNWSPKNEWPIREQPNGNR
jgi:hypothetical protein